MLLLQRSHPASAADSFRTNAREQELCRNFFVGIASEWLELHWDQHHISFLAPEPRESEDDETSFHVTGPSRGAEHFSKETGDTLQSDDEPIDPPPDVIVIVLEGVRYEAWPTDTMANMARSSAEQSAGTAGRRFFDELTKRKMLVHVPQTRATIPHSIMGMFSILCGSVPEPYGTAETRSTPNEATEAQYSTKSALAQSCLPNYLRRQLNYRTKFITSSNSLNHLYYKVGFDEATGFAVGKDNKNVGKYTKTPHGLFEKVNYLGFDDAILLDPTLEALQQGDLEGKPTFLTLLTVGTHQHYRLPVSCKCTVPERSGAAPGGFDFKLDSPMVAHREWDNISIDAGDAHVVEEVIPLTPDKHNMIGAQRRHVLVDPRYDPQKAARRHASAPIAKEPTSFQVKASSAQTEKDLYRCAVAYTDRLLVELVDRLESAGRLDRTLLVVVSDHGEEFGEHGMGKHGASLSDLGTRVPLVFGGGVVRRAVELQHDADGQATGQMRVPGAHSQADVMPTIRDLLEPWLRRQATQPSDSNSKRSEIWDPSFDASREALSRVGLAGRSVFQHPSAADAASSVAWAAAKEMSTAMAQQGQTPLLEPLPPSPLGAALNEHGKNTGPEVVSSTCSIEMFGQKKIAYVIGGGGGSISEWTHKVNFDLILLRPLLCAWHCQRAFIFQIKWRNHI